MNLSLHFWMAFRYLQHRRLATWISMGALGVSLLFLIAVGGINFALKKAAAEGAIRYPLLLGPGGTSGMQAVLSTLFHLDKPGGTLPFSVYQEIRQDRRVLAAYPIASADNLQNFPIVGTNEAFLRQLGGRMVQGKLDLSRRENALLGFAVAQKTGLRLGDRFYGAHGMVGSEDAHAHKELRYKVVGILAPVRGPEDAAVYCHYSTVWSLHQHHTHHKEHHSSKTGHHATSKKHQAPGIKHHSPTHQHQATTSPTHRAGSADKLHLGQGRLTAVLVRTKNPAFTGQLEREWSLRRETVAVDTGRAIRRLVGYLNKAERLVEVLNGVTALLVLLLVLVTLLMSLKERKKELALMRTLGIGRRTIAWMVMLEAFLLAVGGVLLGLLLGHGLLWWAKLWLDYRLGIAVEPFHFTAMEIHGIWLILAAGQLLALAGVAWVYRLNLVEELARD